MCGSRLCALNVDEASSAIFVGTEDGAVPYKAPIMHLPCPYHADVALLSMLTAAAHITICMYLVEVNTVHYALVLHVCSVCGQYVHVWHSTTCMYGQYVHVLHMHVPLTCPAMYICASTCRFCALI